MLEFAEQIETAAPEFAPETPEEARHRAVAQAIAELRPYLQRDGGDCHLVAVEGNIVKIRMSGACLGCQLASMTLHGIQDKLIAKLGFPLRIVPVMGSH